MVVGKFIKSRYERAFCSLEEIYRERMNNILRRFAVTLSLTRTIKYYVYKRDFQAIVNNGMQTSEDSNTQVVAYLVYD